MNGWRILLPGWSLLLTLPVTAAEPDADGLFRRGREAARRGDYSTACPLFKRSYALDPAVGTLLNLARCDEEVGRLLSARNRYREVVAKLAPGDVRSDYARKRLNLLEPRVPLLTLVTPAETPPLEVRLDDAPVAQSDIGSPIAIDPGLHIVEARAHGRQPRRYEVTIAEGEQRLLEVEPGNTQTSTSPSVRSSALVNAATPPPPAPRTAGPDADSASNQPAPASDSAAVRSIAGWGLLGVGTAALAFSGAAAAVVLDRKATVERECDPDLACSIRGKRAADSGLKWSAIGTITFVVGAVQVASGTYLLVTTPSKRARQSASLGIRGRF